MKMKALIPLLLLLSLLVVSKTYSQEFDSSEDDINVNTRNVFVGLGSGFPEYLGLKIGYQLNSDWSLALAVCPNVNSSRGVGNIGTLYAEFKVTKFFNDIFLDINNVCLSLGRSTPKQLEGYIIDISLGSEPKKNRLFNIYWSLGCTFQSTKKIKPYFTPGFKLGLVFNFWRAL